MNIRTWEDQPKRGEIGNRLAPWFASYGVNGHTMDIQGDFISEQEAREYMERKHNTK